MVRSSSREMASVFYSAAIGALLLFTQCITWYHNVPGPPAAEVVPAGGEELPYSVRFLGMGPVTLQGKKEKRGVKMGIESSGRFKSAREQKSRLNYQRYGGGAAPFFLEMNIYHSGGLNDGSALSIYTAGAGGALFVIPGYLRSDMDIECALYSADRRGVYRGLERKTYTVKRRSLLWLAALPFAWINYLTPDMDEVMSAVTRDCLGG